MRRRPTPLPRLLPGALLVIALAACEDESPATCIRPELGTGPCCALTLPDGRRLQGVCVDGRCLHESQPAYDGPCDGDARPDVLPVLADDGPPDVGRPDGRPLDTGPAPVDARPDDARPDDAAVTPCRQVICEPDERCVPETGQCRSLSEGVPGGACRADADCDLGRCLAEAQTGGAVPGGFCSVDCEDDADCAGGRCLAVDGGRLCFEVCDDRGECRDGWTCADPGGRDSCRVDCRLVGCPDQGRCDRETGLCLPAEVPCRYRCAVGESCEQSRCVRLDGTCATDHHCPLDGRCLDGRCVAREFAPCADERTCGAGQRCAPLDEGGACLATCAADADCPIDRACRPDLGACYYTVCGPGTDNGELLGPCDFGGMQARPGTCLPFESPGDAPGYCVEAGRAGPGEPCDEQVDGRTPADDALRCSPGAVCRDDPDDPLHPDRDWARRGRCAALCQPGEPCDSGQCVDFGIADDPQTMIDEAVVFGLCLDVECRVSVAGACPPGERCRPFGLADDAGRCGPAGPAGAGEPCASSDDCADVALCVSRGAGTECLLLCDAAQPAPCDGARCYAEPDWAFGVCL